MTTRALITILALIVGTHAKGAPFLHTDPVAQTDGVDYYEVRVDGDDGSIVSSPPKDLGDGTERLSHDIEALVGSGLLAFEVRACSDVFGCSSWGAEYTVSVNPTGVPTGLILRAGE